MRKLAGNTLAFKDTQFEFWSLNSFITSIRYATCFLKYCHVPVTLDLNPHSTKHVLDPLSLCDRNVTSGKIGPIYFGGKSDVR